MDSKTSAFAEYTMW